MFRDEMKQKLEMIFGMKKTTFDAPSDSFEQDTLFIEIQQVTSRTMEQKATAKVLGSLIVYSQRDKLPYGFFNKRIDLSNYSLTKDFFFFDVDQDVANSPARIRNIFERRTRFLYLYQAQYNPNQGEITSLEIGE